MLFWIDSTCTRLWIQNQNNLSHVGLLVRKLELRSLGERREFWMYADYNSYCRIYKILEARKAADWYHILWRIWNMFHWNVSIISTLLLLVPHKFYYCVFFATDVIKFITGFCEAKNGAELSILDLMRTWISPRI